jgi:RNA polymerase-binding transcription factor DksA
MTSEASSMVLRRSRGRPSARDRLRERLVDGMGMWKAQLAYDMATLDLLAVNPGEDPTSVERATTTLHMLTAVDAIEEFEDALARLEDGRYGTCQLCSRPIPIERLEVLPQTRTCAACPTAADRRLRSRRRRGRLEQRDGCPPQPDWLAAARAAVDPGVLAESAIRHPSTLPNGHAIEHPAPR